MSHSGISPSDRARWKELLQRITNLNDEDSTWCFANDDDESHLGIAPDRYLQYIRPNMHVNLQEKKFGLISLGSNRMALKKLNTLIENGFIIWYDTRHDAFAMGMRNKVKYIARFIDDYIRDNHELVARLAAEGVTWRHSSTAFPGAVAVQDIVELWFRENQDRAYFFYWRDGCYHEHEVLEEDRWEDPEDYKEYVKDPVYMWMVFSKLYTGRYASADAVHADVIRMFDNAIGYYGEGAECEQMLHAADLKSSFDGFWKSQAKSIAAAAAKDAREARENPHHHAMPFFPSSSSSSSSAVKAGQRTMHAGAGAMGMGHMAVMMQPVQSHADSVLAHELEGVLAKLRGEAAPKAPAGVGGGGSKGVKRKGAAPPAPAAKKVRTETPHVPAAPAPAPVASAPKMLKLKLKAPVSAVVDDMVGAASAPAAVSSEGGVATVSSEGGVATVSSEGGVATVDESAREDVPIVSAAPLDPPVESAPVESEYAGPEGQVDDYDLPDFCLDQGEGLVEGEGEGEEKGQTVAAKEERVEQAVSGDRERDDGGAAGRVQSASASVQDTMEGALGGAMEGAMVEETEVGGKGARATVALHAHVATCVSTPIEAPAVAPIASLVAGEGEGEGQGRGSPMVIDELRREEEAAIGTGGDGMDVGPSPAVVPSPPAAVPFIDTQPDAVLLRSMAELLDRLDGATIDDSKYSGLKKYCLAKTVFRDDPRQFGGGEGVSDYDAKIARPMWFKNVRDRLEAGTYYIVPACGEGTAMGRPSPILLRADLELIATNCTSYNADNAQYCRYAHEWSAAVAKHYGALFDYPLPSKRNKVAPVSSGVRTQIEGDGEGRARRIHAGQAMSRPFPGADESSGATTAPSIQASALRPAHGHGGLDVSVSSPTPTPAPLLPLKLKLALRPAPVPSPQELQQGPGGGGTGLGLGQAMAEIEAPHPLLLPGTACPYTNLSCVPADRIYTPMLHLLLKTWRDRRSAWMDAAASLAWLQAAGARYQSLTSRMPASLARLLEEVKRSGGVNVYAVMQNLEATQALETRLAEAQRSYDMSPSIRRGEAQRALLAARAAALRKPYANLGQPVAQLFRALDLTIQMHGRELWAGHGTWPADVAALHFRAAHMKEFLQLQTAEWFGDTCDDQNAIREGQRTRLAATLADAHITIASWPSFSLMLEKLEGQKGPPELLRLKTFAKHFTSPFPNSDFLNKLPPDEAREALTQYFTLVEANKWGAGVLDFGSIRRKLGRTCGALMSKGAGAGQAGDVYLTHGEANADITRTLAMAIAFHTPRAERTGMRVEIAVAGSKKRATDADIAGCALRLKEEHGAMWAEACIDIWEALDYTKTDRTEAELAHKLAEERQAGARLALQAAALREGRSERVETAAVWIAAAMSALAEREMEQVPSELCTYGQGGGGPAVGMPPSGDVFSFLCTLPPPLPPPHVPGATSVQPVQVGETEDVGGKSAYLPGGSTDMRGLVESLWPSSEPSVPEPGSRARAWMALQGRARGGQ